MRDRRVSKNAFLVIANAIFIGGCAVASIYFPSRVGVSKPLHQLFLNILVFSTVASVLLGWLLRHRFWLSAVHQAVLAAVVFANLVLCWRQLEAIESPGGQTAVSLFSILLLLADAICFTVLAVSALMFALLIRCRQRPHSVTPTE